MGNQFQIFVSHDARDAALANTLKELIERLFPNIDVFVSGDNLRGGVVWPESLRGRLESASVILALMTNHSLENLWVHFESGAGFASGKTIPVCAGIEKKTLAPPMSLLHARSFDRSDTANLIKDIAERADSRMPARVSTRIATATQRVEQVLAGLERFANREPAETIVSEIKIDDAFPLQLTAFLNPRVVDEIDGYYLVFIDVQLKNVNSVKGYTVTGLKWDWKPDEIIGVGASRHMEADGLDCFGFDVPNFQGRSLHHKVPRSELWTFPKDLDSGQETSSLVAFGCRPKLEAPEIVRTDGVSLTISALDSQNRALASLTGRFKLKQALAEELYPSQEPRARSTIKQRQKAGMPLPKDDPLFGLIGIGASQRPGGASSRKHESILEAQRQNHT